MDKDKLNKIAALIKEEFAEHVFFFVIGKQGSNEGDTGSNMNLEQQIKVLENILEIMKRKNQSL